MKPNFALSLSFEGIRLLHRAGAGWTLVGEVALDSPDLAGELAMLRKTAVALDPAGLRSKIILPNDQVRYLAIDSTRATEDEIRAHLQDATPYSLDELAWDVVRGGGRTYIAAVARETLDEAENFAVDHRFGPVSFAAVPEEFTFVGEPFLGQTRAATLLLPPGETVERDAVPVRLNAAPARAARVEQVAEGEEVEGTEAPVEPNPEEPAPAAEPVPETSAETAEVAATEPEQSGAAPVPADEPVAPEPPATAAPVPDGAEVVAKTEVPSPAPEEPAAEDPVAAEAPVAEAPAPLAAATDADVSSAEPAVTPAPASGEAHGSAPEKADTDPERPPLAPAPAPAVQVEEPEPTPVFASRARSKRTLVADPKDVPPAPPVAAPTRSAPARGPEEPVFSRRTPPPVSMPAPLAPAVASEHAAPAEPVMQAPAPVAAPPVSTPPVSTPPPASSGRLSIESVAPAPRPATDPTAPRITGVALGAADRPTVVPFAPLRPATPPPAPPTPAPTARIAAFPSRSKPAEAATDAAKLALSTTPPRGKPRFLGLILTAILVVLMLVVALWVGRTDNVVSRFFGGGEADATAVAAAVPVAIPLVQPSAAVEEPAGAEMTTAALPEATAQDIAVADEELVPAATDPIAAEPAQTADLPDAVAAAAAAALVAEAMSSMTDDAAPETVDTLARPAPGGEIVMVTPEEADAFYAATGVWLRAPRLTVTPQAEDIAALAVSPGDATVADRAGVALPPLGPDPGLVAQANPPPAGTRLPRDERGFILATPEGTVTPDGLIIYAGQPPVLPQVRPGTVAPEPDAEPAGAETTETPAPDQALAEPPLRPVARPGSAEAIAEAPPETSEALPGGVALTDLRPPTRPESVAALAPPPPLPSFEGPRPALRPDGLAPEGATSDVAADAPEPVDPQAALAQTLASIVEGAGDPLATATPQAVAVARRPDSRPNNFARVVQQQSERLARATEAAQQQAAPASLGTPEEAAETREEEVVATAAPTSITPRSVSDAATMANVMALREINLIGVYGTPNDRRALVRLANGRYVRVSVGDSLDGGQVAAIGDNALNYIRRGRTITLEIPGG